jgi:FlaA1/EpsC-like NDP-sugar epimerase
MNIKRYDFYSSLNQKIIDGIIAGVSFYLAYQIRFEWRVPGGSAYQLWCLLPAVILGRPLIGSLVGSYRLIWRYIGLDDAVRLTRNHAAFSAVLLIIRLAAPKNLEIVKVPLSIIIVEFMLTLAGTVGVRSLRRLLSEGLAGNALNGKRRFRVLLLGAGRAGVILSKEIASRLDVKAVGFLDDDPKKQGRVINGLTVLGSLAALQGVVREHRVQEVIVCIPQIPRDALRRVWAVCEQLGIEVKLVPTLEEIRQGKVNIAAFRNIAMSDLLGRAPVALGFSENDVAFYCGKRILITGAGGSIGSELAYQLCSVNPSQLILLDKDENGLNDAYLRIQAHAPGLSVQPVVADIRFGERLQSIFAAFSPSIVFHAAAHKHVHLMQMNPAEAVLNNVVGTINLVEQALAAQVSTFVMISTDKAVRPTSVMGATKRVCEMIVQAHHRNGNSHFCCVRFGNVLGSRGSVVPIFREQIANGGPVTITHPEARRFLMTIPEAVCLLIQAGTLSSSGNTFVLEMGEPVLIHSLAQDLIELSGLRLGRDIQIKMTSLRNGEKLDEVLADDSTEKLLPTRFARIHMINSGHINSVDFAEKVSALVRSAHRGSRQEIYQMFDELDIGFQMPTFKDVRPNEDVAAAGLDVVPRKPQSGHPWKVAFPISQEKAS